ncbi:hypothetical protein D3C86_1779620 [compost metagenome]
MIEQGHALGDLRLLIADSTIVTMGDVFDRLQLRQDSCTSVFRLVTEHRLAVAIQAVKTLDIIPGNTRYLHQSGLVGARQHLRLLALGISEHSALRQRHYPAHQRQ